MSGVWTKRGLLTTAIAVWLCTTMSLGYAENETLKRLREVVKEYSDTAKELQKIDQFHIQVALRRAVTAERPSIPYRWSNLHTGHKGEIVLLDFIGPRGNGRLCVDFEHTYYLGGASPIEDEGTVCQNSEGEWENIIVRAVFKGTGAVKQTAAIPRYNPSVVREIQTLLYRLNYNPGPVDGFYGQRTKRAIEFYQRDEGLSITGEVSEELVASLNHSVSTLESLPSAVETAAVNDGPTETLSSDPGGTEGLAMDQNPGPTTPQDTDKDSSSATEYKPIDQASHSSVLASSHKNDNSSSASQHEQSNDKAGVTAPVQTAKTDESPKVVSVDVNSSAASNPKDAEVTASKENPPLSASDNAESQIALAPTTSKTKNQTELQESTDLPHPTVTQVSEEQDTVDRTQIGGRENIKNKDETPAGEESLESKTFETTIEPFKSNWFMVFIGLMFSVIAGVVASRYLSSGTNRSIARHAEMGQVAAELENKIALVVGQADKGLDKAPKLDRNTAARVYRRQTEVVRNPPIEDQNEQGKSFRDIKHLAPQQEGVQGVESSESTVEEVPPTQVSLENLSATEGSPQQLVDETGPQDMVDKSGGQATESKQHDQLISDTTQDEGRSFEETTEGTMESPKDTPTQQPDKEASATDSQDIIIQAIAEFDELIKETESVLAMDLEPESREHITKAIEQATKLIQNAFEKDPVEGDSHKYTKKAIRKAAKLIVEALEEHSTTETLQLRAKNK